MRTIESLRKDGYKVRVIHYRENTSGTLMSTRELKHRNDEYGEELIILSKGGKTHIDITSPDGPTFSGESYCSLKDGFNRKMGNSIALERALANEKI